MAILLIGVDLELGTELIGRLLAQDDEVRVLEESSAAAAHWRKLGAHVASGPQWDADLIERAAQNVRTIVVGPAHRRTPSTLMDAVIAGGGYAAPGMRLVVFGTDVDESVVESLRSSVLDYVVLEAPAAGLLGRRSKVTPRELAEAIDAADDLSGSPRLELDLSDPSARGALRLDRASDS
jgi:hypothetical protein